MTPERLKLVQQLNQELIEGGGLLTLDDLTELARANRVQIWTRGDSLVATEIIDYPQKAVMNVIVAAGRLKDILALEADIEEFARAQGAAAMVTHGRAAWGRVGRRTGWLPVAMRFVKPLPPRTNGGHA
jgi:hypothetical protein